FGKQAQMAAGAERFEYHQDGHPCRYYTKEEMMLIVETALGFVTYHTTYCNALNIWVSSLEDTDAVGAVTYGCEVPEAYQSEVLKDILAARGAGNGEAEV
ncbi:MAG: acyl carrier protein, partial [Lachnospiraceae bacterium]